MILFSAFILGFLSSWHCIGMCGPLTMAVNHSGGKTRFFGAAVYHSGRIFTYAVLGIVMGLIGMTAYMLKLQQYFSILLGIAVVILIFKQQWLNKLTAKYQKSRFMQFVRKKMFNKQNFQTNKGKLFTGMANGLLPCGMVYVALAGAMAQSQITSSVIYMLLFGIGTLPAMMSVHFLPVSWTRKPFFRKWAFAGMLAISCLFFYRGIASHASHMPDDQKVEQRDLVKDITICFPRK